MYDETAKSSVSLAMLSRYPGATQYRRPGMEGKPWMSYAPMLALQTPDPAVGLPSGTVLQPTILVRNTTAKPAAAGITLNWRGDSGRGQVKLAGLNIAPFATQQLQIGAMQKQLGIPDDAHWALVALSTPSSPSDLVAVASSYDASGRYNLDRPFSSNVAGHFAGGEWRSDSNHNQLMAVTNSEQKPTNALLTLHYDNGQKSYQMQQAIQPGDQMWVNVASLIRNRTPDRKGNVLPADATFGTYDLRDLSPGLGSLMQGNLALDGTFGFNAAAPPYGTCCGTSFPGWDPDQVVFDGPGGLLGVQIDGTDSCDSELEDISPDFNSWWSGNTAVALVTKQQVQAVSTGTTTGSASGSVMMGVGGYCAWRPVQVTAPVYVGPPQITSFDPNPIMIGVSNTTLTINGSGFDSSPTVTLPAGITSTGQGSTDSQIVLQGVSVSFSATKIGSNNVTVTANSQTSAPAALVVNGPNQMVVQNDIIAACVGAPYQCRFVSYTVKNYDGTLAANIPIAENISFSGYNCQQSNPGSTTAQCNAQNTTDGSGNFTDQWSMYTGFTPAGCGENITDHWQWCGPTGVNPNPGITFGTLIGYAHTATTDINGFINPPNKIPTDTVFAP